jgi:hypothetical protein
MRKAFYVLVIVSAALSLFGCVIASQIQLPLCRIEALFVCPEVDRVIEYKLIELMDSATQTLDIAMYYFTDDDLGEAVIRAYRRGVKVRILLDESQVGASGGEYQRLIAEGIPVAIENTSGLMHHKFVIIDKKVTITGSYNWTASADDNNFENIVIISCPEIAQAYTQEFENLWERFKVEDTRKAVTTGVKVIISAVLPNPSGLEPDEEWIELYNLSDVPVDISGWRLSDGEGSYVFPQGTVLAPKASLRVYGRQYNPTGYSRGLYLANKGDEVYLYDASGRLIDQCFWEKAPTDIVIQCKP